MKTQQTQRQQHIDDQQGSLNEHVKKYGRHAGSRDSDLLEDEILLRSKTDQSSKTPCIGIGGDDCPTCNPPAQAQGNTCRTVKQYLIDSVGVDPIAEREGHTTPAQEHSPLSRTNFRGELIQSEPEILNRLLARAERAEANAQRLAEELAVAKSQIENNDATLAQVRLNEKHKAQRLADALGEASNALADVTAAYQNMFDLMPVAWQTYDDIANAALLSSQAALAQWEGDKQ